MSSILKIEFEKLRKTKSFWAIMLFLVFITSTVAITRSLEVGGSIGGINPAEPRAENGYFFEDNSAYAISLYNVWIGSISGDLFFTTIFYFILPLAATLPFSFSLSDESKSGYLRQMTLKKGQMRYYFAKYIVTFTSGFLLAAIPLLINVIITACYIPAYKPDPLEQLYSGQYYGQYTLIFVLAGVAARIAYVNITAEKPIIEYYSENEWAGLNGSYIRSWEENTEGYSVKIVGYEVMEKEKYFSKYDLSGKDQSVADPFAYIMEVTIKIKNEENETGKLQIADWALIGKNDDFIAYLDQQLLMDTDERVDSILSSISTASGKEIEIKLPYPLIYMDKEKEIDRNMPYKIAVTKYPSRKYIQFG